MIYFLTIYFFLFSVIAMRNLTWALAIIVALLPSYLIRFELFILPTTLLEGMILITIGVWFLQIGFKQVKLKYQNKIQPQVFPFQKQIILIMITATIAIFISSETWKALGLWRAYFLEPILFFLIFIQVINSKQKLSKILYALGFSAIIISLFAIYQKITGEFIPVKMWQPENMRRVTSFYTSPNAVGLFLAPIIMIYLGWVFENKAKKLFSFLWQIFTITIAIFAIIFTMSEGTWVGLIVALIFFTFLSFFHQIKYKKSIIIFAILISIIIPLLNIDKIQTIIATPSAQNRLTLWNGSLNFLTENPKNFIFGAGIFGFPVVQDKFRDPLKLEPLIYPHNIFLNFWMEIGLLGMIAFIWMFISFFSQSINIIKKRKSFIIIGVTCALVTILVHGLLDVPYFKNDLALLFWVIIGVFIISKKLLEENTQK